MKILVVGAGMYVTGRDQSGPGTILCSLAELSKSLMIEITVVATNPANNQVVADAVNRINSTIGANLKAEYRCISGNSEEDIPALCAAQNYDAAIVSVPDHLHYLYTKHLLLQGIHPLVVKPFVPTMKEARELVNLQRELGLYGAVEFHKRWDLTNLWIRKTLQAHQLGQILYVTVDYSQKITIPRTTFKSWAAQTNIFQYLGVHYVDMIYFLTGYIPVRAFGVGSDGVLKKEGIETWDSVHSTIIWQSPDDPQKQFISQFATNWIDPECSSAMSDQKYKVVGTHGRIECDQKNRGVEFVREGAGIQQINPYFSDFHLGENGNMRFCGYGHDSISRFILDVIDLQNNRVTLETLEKKRPSFYEALVSTAVVDAVNRSLNNASAWEAVDVVL